MAASGGGGMKGGIRRLKARAMAVNVTMPPQAPTPSLKDRMIKVQITLVASPGFEPTPPFLGKVDCGGFVPPLPISPDTNIIEAQLLRMHQNLEWFSAVLQLAEHRCAACRAICT
jgi:hypothetical protein